jgi:ubiquitin carboxyl-terminal hydrolase 4/11/15
LQSSLPRTTASSSTTKKRKLAPFASISQHIADSAAPFDTATYEAHQRESSSPQSSAPSPEEGRASPSTTATARPGALPPHVQEEIDSAGVAPAGQSPSGAFAEIHIHSGSSTDMSGSENGQDISVKTDGEVQADRSEMQRAASPAKRSAGEMEGNAAQQPDSNEDVAMAGTANDLYDQDNGANTTSTSLNGTMSTNTSATSFQSEDQPPPYTAEDSNKDEWKVAGGEPLPSIDEQVSEVMQLSMKPLEHGDRGNVVSVRWLQRVRARTTEELSSTKFPKAAREGDIGPVDNSDIVPSNAFDEPVLHDISGHAYIPLKQGLTMDEDFMVLPDDAWGKIIGWYGIATGQKQITRYAHNTAPEEALMPNVVYELNPPVFLIRKLPQPAQDGEKANEKSNSAMRELRMKSERRQRGQMKADDALMVVSSRQEKANSFLKRVKEYAEIPISHKVRIWRVLNPTNIAVDTPGNTQSGVASPPLSRETSPSSIPLERTKLVVEIDEWQKMDVGKDLEQLDIDDQTANQNYNGSSTIEIFSLFENQTLILEEQTRGPAGGEYPSDQKKKKLLAKGSTSASKPSSTVNSRRTSPAPGGAMTRGREARNGKTRGRVGLTNLGNTCYMNSALQCIRSVEELAIYFLQDKYKSEINHDNPLGSGGVMAKKYAEVLQGLYGENASSSFSPTNFKRTLSSQNPVFSGWGQQDSQEFLSYLVDSIHEDLNRIQKKPYLENPDSDDARVNDPEYIRELGDIYRQNHAKRNESVCMDLFSGFYKNTMECPSCDKVSVTFDPFASLTLQLPMESTFMLNLTFVPHVGRPVNHNLDLEKNLTMKDVKKIVASKHNNVDASKLWMAEVYNHKLYKYFDDRTSVAEANFQANDYIFIFELAEVPSNIPPPHPRGYVSLADKKKLDGIPEMTSEAAENFVVPIFHRKKNRFGSGWDVAMHPQYITVKREEAKDYEALLKKILHTVAQLTSRPILMEAETERSSSSDTERADTEGDAEARLSDHSVSSEDGYVSVSMNGDAQSSPTDEAADAAQSKPNTEGAKVPDGFFDPDYNLPAILRDQLFTFNYARGAENKYCFGTTGFEDKAVRNVKSRVKAPSRRLSSSSSTAGESSTNDASSPASTAADEEESDEDEDEEKSAQTSAEDPAALIEDDSETASELPEDPIQSAPVASNMRGNKKQNKFKGNKSRKAKDKRSKKQEKRELKQAKAREYKQQSPRSTFSNDEPDDEVFYIKLGECIVLDWYPEAIDSIFLGDANDSADARGHWLSADNGQNLPFVHDPATEAKRQRRELRKKNGISLEDCFMETGKREKLSEDNAWYCNNCKELRQATKTLEIWTCPDIVVVHLKRFGGTRSFRDKIDVKVDYPVEGLDLTSKIGQKEDGKEYLYDLFAVDNHFGGLGGGHYTASAKNFFDGQWYDYNGK